MKIYRRFSDIELLHEGLINSLPGCLIPPLPSKSFWMNVYASNNESNVQLRKKQIEDYLMHIISHKYLSVSHIFQLFLSDKFAQYKKKHLIEQKALNSQSLTNVISKLFDSGNKSMAYEDNDERTEVEVEESETYKIQQGVNAMTTVVTKEVLSIRQNRERIKDIIDKALGNDNDNDNGNKELMILVFNKMQKRMTLYEEEIDKLLNQFFEPFCVMIGGMTEIFKRKKKIEMFLYKENQEDFITNNKKSEIEKLTVTLNEMIPHLNEEIQLFKLNKGKELIDNISLFFQLKKEYEEALKNIFNQTDKSETGL